MRYRDLAKTNSSNTVVEKDYNGVITASELDVSADGKIKIGDVTLDAATLAALIALLN